MHNNYYFLKHLTTSLQDKLVGFLLVEAFSQNKNELILGFTAKEEVFYLKAYLDPAFCCLSFPKDFSRARKNSVDLFNEIINLSVKKVNLFENERCFSLIFDNGYQLLFKMHGNRSNIISFKYNEVSEVFKKNLKNDNALNPDSLDRPIDQSFASFENYNGNYSKLFPTFGSLIKAYLHAQHYDEKAFDEKWNLIQDTLNKLSKPTFYIVEYKHSLHLSLLEIGLVLKKFNNPIHAINDFFSNYISENSLRRTKKTALNTLNKKLKQSENYIAKAENKLQEISDQLNYSKLADIIMANLHQIPAQSTGVILENFYDENRPITIKLNRALSPQHNAENYYRKAKNQTIEINSLRDNLDLKKQQINKLKIQIAQIEDAPDLKSLREIMQTTNAFQFGKKEQHTAKPFNSFSFQKFDIWVGKNAKSNDLMLQKFSFKDDLWLHAKDVSGSHVLIKYQSGKNFSKAVKEKAAQLAAYFSKRKTDSLCPVIITPRKFVRKKKGAPSGAVIVDKEQEIILVKPHKWT